MKKVVRKKLHFFLCKMLFKFFLYYFSHIEDVFLFLIYFSGGLFDIIIIDFHWKVCTLVLLLRLVWHGRRKNFLSCFMLVWNHFVWVFMNIFGFSLKTKNYNQLRHILYNKKQYLLYIRHVYTKKPTTVQFHKKFEILKFYLIVMYRNVIILYCNCSVFLLYIYIFI